LRPSGTDEKKGTEKEAEEKAFWCLMEEQQGKRDLAPRSPLPMEIVDPAMARVLAAKTEVQRLVIGWGMWRSAVRMMTRILRAEHPDWSEEEIGREVAGRMSRGG
jgi:hypothetical protein